LTTEKEENKAEKREKPVERKVAFDESLSIIKEGTRVSAAVATAIQNPPPPKSKKPEDSEGKS